MMLLKIKIKKNKMIWKSPNLIKIINQRHHKEEDPLLIN
jgi:hypothetical protein